MDKENKPTRRILTGLDLEVRTDKTISGNKKHTIMPITHKILANSKDLYKIL